MFQLLQELGSKAPGRCLLVGGLALAEHGRPRLTYDIDIAISQADIALFDKFIPFLSFRKIAETYCAARYRHTSRLPDLDILYLEPAHFDQLWERRLLGQCGVPVISSKDWGSLSAESCAEKSTFAPEKSELQMESWLADMEKRIRAEFDPVRYVQFREECPLPKQLNTAS